MLILGFFVLPLLSFGNSARILAIVPTPFYSHQSVFFPIWEELSLRGHQVTLITTNPKRNSSLINLQEIDLSFTYKLIFEDLQMEEILNKESRMFVLMKHGFVAMTNMTTEQLKHSRIQEFIQSDQSFDLVISEIHVPAWFGFAKKYNCPIILITSMPVINFYKHLVGNINNPVYTHSFNLPFGNNLSFLERVIAVVFEIIDHLYHLFLVFPIQESLIREALNDTEINLLEIAKNCSLLFSNEIPGFEKVTYDVPSVIRLNGLQILPPQELPIELKQFLDESPQGIIYFSLGSNVKSYLICKDKQEMLLKTFSELPYKVIWKFEDKVENLPANVIVTKWAPQQDILRHNNTKLFITQGGLQSIDEAIRFKVPILSFPFFGDQFYNSKRVEFLKLGTWCDFKSLTGDLLKIRILETVNNDTYLRNFDEIADLLSHPFNSLPKAIWWIEYVLRHKGASNLRSPLANMPFYQYYLLDVISFLVIIFLLIILICMKLIKFSKNLFRGINPKAKTL